MKRLTLLLAAFAALVLPASAGAAGLVALAPEEAWQSSPIAGASPPGDPRFFVVERGGVIRIVKDGVLQPTPFLTIPNVDTNNERGLLSLAFSPIYATTGHFYVFMVASGPDAIDPAGQKGDVRVVEFQRSAGNPDLADPNSGRLVLKQAHNNGNHNGGQLMFGPENLLYVTLGENEISANAPKLDTLLGKVLRINPGRNGVEPYSVPPSNPFVNTPGARPEIYARGVRNPFRASFGPGGELIVADVGDYVWEEVNVGRPTGTPAATTMAGANLGWPTCEGACTPPDPNFFDPAFQYSHAATGGCAIIGGYVVRDKTLTGLTGRYLYGDTCLQDLRTLNLSVAGADPRAAGFSYEGGALIGLGEDARGCTYAFTSLTAYRVAPTDNSSAACPDAALGPPDTRKPRLKLRGSHRQPLRRSLRIFARCDESCALSASAVLRPRSAGRKGKNRAASAAVRKPIVTKRNAIAGKRVRLRVKLRRGAFRRAAKELRRGYRATVRVRVSAGDASGNVARGSFLIRLKHPRR